MTKSQAPKHSRASAPEESLATIIMESLANLVEKARLEILAELKAVRTDVQDLQGDVEMIARQIKRESTPTF